MPFTASFVLWLSFIVSSRLQKCKWGYAHTFSTIWLLQFIPKIFYQFEANQDWLELNRIKQKEIEAYATYEKAGPRGFKERQIWLDLVSYL